MPLGLDPDIAAILSSVPGRPSPPPPGDDAADLAYARQIRVPTRPRPNPVAVAEVSERELFDRFRVRVYRPAATRPLPVLVYLHGGGWALGDLDMQDDTCRRLAAGASCVVVSVDYRLAPEHRFPAALDDAYNVLAWSRTHAREIGGAPGRLAVAGGSAGGNLAAAAALGARDAGDPSLELQVLIYPALDSSMTEPSYTENATGYMLSRDMMTWFWGQYVPEPAEARNPLASPSFAADLSGLPPALVETAEFDPLRDEGERYARRLAAAGVDVELNRHNGLIHGYLGMFDASGAARLAVTSLIKRVSDRFAAVDS
jgi:acetyl esterase